MVKHLFQNLLDDAFANAVIFARRGKAARIDALSKALGTSDPNAPPRYAIEITPDPAKWNDENGYIQETLDIASSITDRGGRRNVVRTISTAYPHQHVGLQVADYYLWALQRLFEKREERFFNLVSKDFRLIMDLDDKRERPEGQWYSASRPLTLEQMPQAG